MGSLTFAPKALAAGFLTRLFMVLVPRAAVTMTVAGGALGYESQVKDLRAEVPDQGPVMSEFTLDFLDLSGVLPAHGSKSYLVRDESIITGIVWHHTATPSTTDWKSIASYHINGRNWAGIAYHVGIDRDGRILLLNDFSSVSNHTAGYNAKNVGVVLLGNYEVNRPTKAMEAGIEKTRKYIQSKGIMQEKLHKDVKATLCPGRYAEAVLR